MLTPRTRRPCIVTANIPKATGSGPLRSRSPGSSPAASAIPANPRRARDRPGRPLRRRAAAAVRQHLQPSQPPKSRTAQQASQVLWLRRRGPLEKSRAGSPSQSPPRAPTCPASPAAPAASPAPASPRTTTPAATATRTRATAAASPTASIRRLRPAWATASVGSSLRRRRARPVRPRTARARRWGRRRRARTLSFGGGRSSRAARIAAADCDEVEPRHHEARCMRRQAHEGREGPKAAGMRICGKQHLRTHVRTRENTP